MLNRHDGYQLQKPYTSHLIHFSNKYRKIILGVAGLAVSAFAGFFALLSAAGPPTTATTMDPEQNHIQTTNPKDNESVSSKKEINSSSSSVSASLQSNPGSRPKVKSKVTVNGQTFQSDGSDGSLHKTITSDDGNSRIEIDIQNNTGGSANMNTSFTNLNVNSHSSAYSESNSP